MFSAGESEGVFFAAKIVVLKKICNSLECWWKNLENQWNIFQNP